MSNKELNLKYNKYLKKMNILSGGGKFERENKDIDALKSGELENPANEGDDDDIKYFSKQIKNNKIPECMKKKTEVEIKRCLTKQSENLERLLEANEEFITHQQGDSFKDTKALEESIKKDLEPKLNKLREENSRLKKEKDQLTLESDSQMAEVGQNLKESQQKTLALEKKIKECGNEKTELQSLNESLKKDKEKLQTQANDKENVLTRQREKISDLESKQNDYINKFADIEHLRKVGDESYKKLENDYLQIQNKNQNLIEALQKMQKKIKNKEELEGQIKSLKSENKKLTQQNEELTEELKTIKQELEEKIKELESSKSVESLESEMQQSTKIDTLKKEIESLKIELAAKPKEIITPAIESSEENKKLRTQIEELQRQISVKQTLSSDSILIEENSTLKKKLDDYEKIISSNKSIRQQFEQCKKSHRTEQISIPLYTRPLNTFINW